MTNNFLYKHKIVLFVLFIVTLIQSICVVYGEVGSSVVGEAVGLDIPNKAFYEYFKDNGMLSVILGAFKIAFLLFILQIPFTVIYLFQETQKEKLRFAIAFWLLPPIIFFFTIFFPFVYFLSPLASIAVVLDLSDLILDKQISLDKEMFTESWFFPCAVLGWYHLFWLGLTIKHICTSIINKYR